jgi:hypothetical protein
MNSESVLKLAESRRFLDAFEGIKQVCAFGLLPYFVFFVSRTFLLSSPAPTS